MLAYLGAILLIEVWESPVQLSWVDWTFGIAIMLVICNFGYLQGVGLGVVVACLMFALSYSRVGVVRRELTREDFSSNVERSREQFLLLQREGKRIHELWLSGFIFFGSSNVIFERIKQIIEQQQDKPLEYVVLDFSRVSGLDTSAALSIAKLRDFCDWHSVALAFSGFNEGVRLKLLKHGLRQKLVCKPTLFASRLTWIVTSCKRASFFSVRASHPIVLSSLRLAASR
jgi:SulP family sulfate permease